VLAGRRAAFDQSNLPEFVDVSLDVWACAFSEIGIAAATDPERFCEQRGEGLVCKRFVGEADDVAVRLDRETAAPCSPSFVRMGPSRTPARSRASWQGLMMQHWPQPLQGWPWPGEAGAFMIALLNAADGGSARAPAVRLWRGAGPRHIPGFPARSS
jgi:hypothetical protein